MLTFGDELGESKVLLELSVFDLFPFKSVKRSSSASIFK